MKRMALLTVAIFSGLLSAFAQEGALLKTDSFVLEIGADGRATQFRDALSGKEYCDRSAGAAFAALRAGGSAFQSSSAEYVNGLLSLGFAGMDGTVSLRVVAEHRRLRFEVVSCTCGDVDELLFGRIPLTLKGDFEDAFAVSPLALNANTNCLQIPGLSFGLSGFIALKRFGIAGASGAVVACPTTELRDALKETVTASPDLAWSPLGGPWALDAPINQGSYLIAMDECVTAENVDKWIAAARMAGASQLDFHGGKAFRWGDFEVNKAIYPQGRDSLKAVVDAVHQAGMAAGLHTYAFFIAKDSPWVTPVPDARLASDATFTLAEELAENADTIPVAESTADMSAITGFQVRNSATLRLDDELITYTGVEKQAPFAFTGCVRGAYGTHAAQHPQGTKALHLKECFGLFVPQGDSSLFTEVAQRTADLYNTCGFDMMYLDALDGSDILEGPAYAWHFDTVFVDELLRRVQKPAVMEMSTFSHHLWRARSRMQAWDCAQRCVKAFVDCHVAGNRQWKAAFLPTHLGWWGSFDWAGLQPERTFPDDMEYVCAKALATDSSLSYIVGFSPLKLDNTNTQRLGAIARRYETLRAQGTVPASVKERLATPGQDFSLEILEDGRAQFRPAKYVKHALTAGNDAGKFSFTNPYAAQPLRLRIEAELVPAAYDAPAGKLLTAFDTAAEFTAAETQQGVTASLTPAEGVREEAVLTACNTGVESDRAWASFGKEYSPCTDFTNMGLGLWVTGDGKGEVLNIQMRSPKHLSGGFADHYIPVDFTGRRYFQLVEPESDALGAYEWAHTRKMSDIVKNPLGTLGFLYSMYHIWMAPSQIASLTVSLNNLPKETPVQVGIGPIKALPLSVATLVNPAIAIAGRTVTFPVELASGSYLECLAPDQCAVYDYKGECLGAVVFEGQIPEVSNGGNDAVFLCAPQGDVPARARVTVMLYDTSFGL